MTGHNVFNELHSRALSINRNGGGDDDDDNGASDYKGNSVDHQDTKDVKIGGSGDDVDDNNDVDDDDPNEM